MFQADVNAYSVGCVSATYPKGQNHAHVIEIKISLTACKSIHGNMFIGVKVWHIYEKSTL